jgi:hypothetical protein
MRLSQAALVLLPVFALAHLSQAATLLSESNSQAIFIPLGIGLGNG